MPGVLMPENATVTEPQELLDWTMVCRKAWEGYLQRKHNGLSRQMQGELLREFSAMENVVRHLIPEEPVRVEGRAIVYDPSRMEQMRIYSVEVQGRLHLVRRTGDNTVETYELEPAEQ